MRLESDIPEVAITNSAAIQLTVGQMPKEIDDGRVNTADNCLHPDVAACSNSCLKMP